MPDTTKLIYWDANIFLSYINGEKDRLPVIDAIFEEVERSGGKIKIVTSTISKVEVAFSVIESDSKALNDDIEQQIDSLWSDNSVIQLIEFHDSISSIARDIIRKGLPIGWKLKPMDAIQLASAKWINSKEFYTYDPQLKRYTDIIGCKICEPYIEQPKLPM